MCHLSATGCATRRQRVSEMLAEQRLDAAVLTDVRDVYYFTGTLLPSDLPAVCLLSADGRTHLIGPAGYSVDDVHCLVQYEWNYRGTRDPDAFANMVNSMADAWQPARGTRFGVQQHSLLNCVRHGIERFGGRELVPIETFLAALQRRKDADEVEIVRGSIRVNLAAYDAVAHAIRPGANELDVLSAGRRGSTKAAGETVFHDGDYQCGQFNGPARDRPIDAGELYIVDAWTCYRGYWSDMARTFVVGIPATDVQHALFDHIRWVQSEVPRLLRPGADGTEIYGAIDEMIREHPPLADAGLVHHGGHAIGLRNHEMPDINLRRGGMLEPGNIICIEPGGYFAAARYGVRLEDMYLITEQGCENLCPDKVELVVCR